VIIGEAMAHDVADVIEDQRVAAVGLGAQYAANLLQVQRERFRWP
jgi:hypothetical protein